MTEYHRFHFDETLIKNRLLPLDSPERLVMKDTGFTSSAILFLIVAKQQKPYDLVLIRRTKRENDKHSGEMGFPGGRVETSDLNLEHTALRECKEELGIPMERINVLGAFDDHITPQRYIITPIVGYVKEGQKMNKQIEEVDEIVPIPVSFFANKKNYRERNYLLNQELIGVGKYKYKSQSGNKYVIFGATSHIIVHFIQTVYDIQLMKKGARRLNCADINNQEKRFSKIASELKKKFLK